MTSTDSSEGFARIRVFVASPGDVAIERAALSKVVKDVNLAIDAFAPGRAIVELLEWETKVVPGMGRAQAVINRQIGDYDFLVGIMWRRFGTPTGVAASGTEEEFRRAYKQWEAEGVPEILFYFSQQEATPSTSAESRQQTAVLEFREELEQVGLVKLYANAQSFADVVRRDLLLAVGRRLHGSDSAARTAQRLAQPELGVASELEQQLRTWAQVYDRTRELRAPGSDRTHALDEVAAQMRGVAGDLYHLLDELATSPTAGERLAAVMFLQAVPHAGYIEWLAERFRRHAERPFIQYQSAVALLMAVRTFAESHGKELSRAIGFAQEHTAAAADSDRSRVLRQAEQELGKRRKRSR